MSGHTVIVAGFGGQGLLFAGKVLAQAANLEGRDVSWMPAYGPEMRGGTASCTVIVADTPIGSPIADVADSVIALNPPSMARFEPMLAAGGLLVVNTTLIEAEPRRTDIEVAAFPCTALARAAGHDRLASIVALGVLVARRPIVARESVIAALGDLTGGDVGGGDAALLADDVAAFQAGWGAGASPAARLRPAARPRTAARPRARRIPV